MSRASLGEAHPKIIFTMPFLIKKKKKKSLKYISIISKFKTYIIQRYSSREWLTLNQTKREKKPLQPSK